MLAMRDFETSGRVDVWTNDGNHILGFCPEDADKKIHWIGWDRQNHLLTVCDGILAAWEVPTAKALYEIDGGYSGPVDATPGRNWLALAADKHVDLIDVATGKCLGRCTADVPGSVAEISDVLASPDGARLAAVYMPDQTAVKWLQFAKVNPTSDDFDATLVHWDL